MFNITKKSIQWGQETLTLESGRVARQADGSVIATLGETSVMGKPQGSDSQSDKATFPKLLGLPSTKHLAAQLIDQAVHALDRIDYNTDLLKQFAHYIIQRDH